MQVLSTLLEGLWITLQLTAGGAAVGIAVAFVAGLGRLAKFAPLRWLATVYVEVFRGTSALVQLFWFYFVLPFLGVRMDAMTVGIVVLGLNAGAYGAEVVRGSVLSVGKGQYEAATALNFTPRQTLWRIVLPQAVVPMLPPFGNILIELLKNTALVSLITISELTFAAQTLRAETLETTEIFSVVLLLYFMVALCITGAIRLLERRMAFGISTGGAR